MDSESWTRPHKRETSRRVFWILIEIKKEEAKQTFEQDRSLVIREPKLQAACIEI